MGMSSFSSKFRFLLLNSKRHFSVNLTELIHLYHSFYSDWCQVEGLSDKLELRLPEEEEAATEEGAEDTVDTAATEKAQVTERHIILCFYLKMRF